MTEQRTNPSAPPSSYAHAARPPRAPSIASLRSTQRGKQPQSQNQPLPPSRRQSLETAEREPYYPSGSSSEIMSRHTSQTIPHLSASPHIRTGATRTPRRRASSSSSDREGPGDRTPTAPSSPQAHRASVAPSQRSISSVAHATGRPLNAPLQGYGATHEHHASLGPLASIINGRRGDLGKGEAPSRSSTVDSVLSSPRRISTTYVPQTAQPARHPAQAAHIATMHRSPGSIPERPVTQPNTGTRLNFRSDQQHPGQEGSIAQPAWTPHSERLAASTSNLHKRNQASLTVPNSPNMNMAGLKSPVGSFAHSLRHSASRIGLAIGGNLEYDPPLRASEEDNDDDEGEEEDAEHTNGTRVWYSSFASIDWVHDAIKESARVRRLRHRATRSVRGAIANAWDRFQGWLVVTIIGILSAVVAFLIIRLEAALFDLKEGFCTTSWGTSRQFCCSASRQDESGAAVRGPKHNEICPDWIEWGDFFSPHGPEWQGPLYTRETRKEELFVYAGVALVLATVASLLTIYLSSSAHHTTSKDSTLMSTPATGDVKRQSPGQSSTERSALLDPDSPTTANGDPYLLLHPPQRQIMYYAAGSGIPEIKTILSGFVIHGYLGTWTLFTKAVGLSLSVASGLSLGKEGPLVHISSCNGNIISRLFLKFKTNEAKRREILSAACAAGVSVAFGAPIGGVLFSLEEVSYFFPPKVMWRSFWCAAVAAITLKSLNPFGNGSLVLFAVTYTKEYHYWEFGVFILLGVFGGVYGAVFSRLNFLWSRHVRQGTWVGRHPIVEVMLVTLLTTMVSFMNPYCRLGGTELVATLFTECTPHSTSPICVKHVDQIGSLMMVIGTALVTKGVLTIITFGIKLPAGIFIPSLAVGACFGRMVGLAFEWIEAVHPKLGIFGVCRETQCVEPGLYAMIGAAATLAGVTRTTISLAVIIVELTGTLDYVVPIMLGVLVAKTVADGIESKGIYDLVIDLNQLPYLDQKHEHLWGARRASEVAERDIPILRADKTHTVRSLTAKLLELARADGGDTGFPVLTKEMVWEGERHGGGYRVVGLLGMNELEHVLDKLQADPNAMISLTPGDSLRHSTASLFSIEDSWEENRLNPYDLAQYVDRAPITVQTHSPLELVQQLFVKLGARQILVTDSRGIFRGMITKKGWLRFLAELEEGNH